MSVLSPNMALPVPTVGVTPASQYATDMNNCMSIIDSHTHIPGSNGGVAITPAAMNINADLSMAGNDLTLVRSVRFSSQISPISGVSPDTGCLYESGVDLYYNDGNGNQIRITQSGSVSGSSGTITGLPSGTASASYGAGVFTFQAATNTPANINMGSAVLGNNTTSGYALTLSPPTLSSNYSLVLPALPLATGIMQVDNTGNMSASLVVDNSTLQNSGTVLSVKDLGITAAKIANGTITGTQIANNITLAGLTVKAGSKNVIVGNTNTGTNGLALVRGLISSAGATLGGEGFSAVRSNTGLYTISFTAAFLDPPAVTATAVATSYGGVFGIANVISSSTTGCVIYIAAVGVGPIDLDFHFNAIAVRAT